MRAFILVLGAFWVLWAAWMISVKCSAADASEPYGQLAIDTRPYPADGILRDFHWPNPTGHTIYIHSVRLSLFFNYGLYGDCQAKLWRASDGSVLIPGGSDHYAMNNTATGNNDDRSFEPRCVQLGPNDSLTLSAYVKGFIAPLILRSGVSPADKSNLVWDNGNGQSTVYNAMTGQTWAKNNATGDYTALDNITLAAPLIEQPWASRTDPVQQIVWVWYTKDAR
jgi:hypothetical protein